MFTNLQELITSMPTEKQCRDYLVSQRWPDGKVICPYCGCSNIYRVKERDRFKCGNAECYKKFSVTVGTIFEASKIPLFKWLTAVYLSSAHKKGISSYQLGKDVGVSQKSAWFMLHRIREMMRQKDNIKLDNIVEIDETFIGGIVGNMSKVRRAKLRTANNGTIQNKNMVIGLLERSGNLKLVAMGKDTGMGIIQPVVRQHVDTDAVLITDSSNNYEGLHNEYAGHEIINHSMDEYVRDKVIHTNSIEGVFSMLKRSIIGIYHQVTPKHLSRYCDETMYRYNTRKMKDPNRFALSLQNVEGRLKYKDLIASPDNSEIRFSNGYVKGAGHILQFKGNELVGQYHSQAKAAKLNGLSQSKISAVLRGLKKTTGGFRWEYA